MFTNSECLRNKMTDIKAVVSTQHPDVISICETWMQEDPLNEYFYPTECLQLTGYNLYRYDNPTAVRGGIILYIKPDLDGGPCKKMAKFSNSFEESAWHWLRVNTGKSTHEL